MSSVKFNEHSVGALAWCHTTTLSFRPFFSPCFCFDAVSLCYLFLPMSLQGQDTTASTSSFITALVLNGAIFAAELLLFSILRPQFQVRGHYERKSVRWYWPLSLKACIRTKDYHRRLQVCPSGISRAVAVLDLLHSKCSKRVDALPSGVFNWVLAVFNSDPAIILRVNGMDAYFFVRFLRMMVRMFLPSKENLRMQSSKGADTKWI